MNRVKKAAIRFGITLAWFLLVTTSTFLRGQQLPSLAIIDFEALGISTQEAGILTSRLSSHIVRLDVYRVIERAQIEEILAEQDFQLTGCTSDECAVQIGQLIGAQLILAGTYGRLGETFSIDMRIIDVETGSILRTASYDVRGEIDHVLTVGIPQAARQIAGLPFEEKISPTAGPDYSGAAVLNIESHPSGALVMMDDDTLGTTPLRTSALAPGREIQINISLSGYYSEDTTIALEASSETTVDLELKAVTGWLNLEGEEGIHIDLNGKKIGQLPIDTFTLPIGAYTISARMPEYYTLTKGLEIKERQEEVLTIQLERKPTFHAIALSSFLPGTGQVYMGYRVKGLVLLLCSAAMAYQGYREHMDAVAAHDEYKKSLAAYMDSETMDNIAASRAEVERDFDIMQDHIRQRNLMLGGFGGLWLISLVDVSF